ncbi:hypothetical protein N431DRAFT_452232 [Stipitochalara longipes BDJ]|nr:hypothetical protein N431DRAFT_452232 [Stipitochalara longipes BDJ]
MSRGLSPLFPPASLTSCLGARMFDLKAKTADLETLWHQRTVIRPDRCSRARYLGSLARERAKDIASYVNCPGRDAATRSRVNGDERNSLAQVHDTSGMSPPPARPALLRMPSLTHAAGRLGEQHTSHLTPLHPPSACVPEESARGAAIAWDPDPARLAMQMQHFRAGSIGMMTGRSAWLPRGNTNRGRGVCPSLCLSVCLSESSSPRAGSTGRRTLRLARAWPDTRRPRVSSSAAAAALELQLQRPTRIPHWLWLGSGSGTGWLWQLARALATHCCSAPLTTHASSEQFRHFAPEMDRCARFQPILSTSCDSVTSSRRRSVHAPSHIVAIGNLEVHASMKISLPSQTPLGARRTAFAARPLHDCEAVLELERR